MLGNMLGQHVAMKKALAQQSSSNLDAAIKEANANNASATKNLASLRSQLATLKARAAKAKASGNTRELSQVKTELRALQTSVNNGSKSVGATGEYLGKLSTAYKGNAKYASIQSGLTTSTNTRAGYDSLSKEIGAALNEF